MSETNGLVVFHFIEGQRAEVSFRPVFAVDQTAHFIPQVIEENDSRRARSLSLDDFAIDDAGMLAFLIRNHHPEFTVLFDDVDALDIYLLKLLLSTLQRESRGNQYDTAERGNDGVRLQEPHFFFQFRLHTYYLLLSEPPNARINAAARVHTGRAGGNIMKNTLPPLALNELLCGASPQKFRIIEGLFII